MFVYTVHLVWEGRGGQREGRGETVHNCCLWGQQFTSWVENTSHEWMYLQSIKSVKHNAAKSVNRSILKKIRHIGFGVFIVQSSMVGRMDKKITSRTVSIIIWHLRLDLFLLNYKSRDKYCTIPTYVTQWNNYIVHVHAVLIGSSFDIYKLDFSIYLLLRNRRSWVLQV